MKASNIFKTISATAALAVFLAGCGSGNSTPASGNNGPTPFGTPINPSTDAGSTNASPSVVGGGSISLPTPTGTAPKTAFAAPIPDAATKAARDAANKAGRAVKVAGANNAILWGIAALLGGSAILNLTNAQCDKDKDGHLTSTWDCIKRKAGGFFGSQVHVTGKATADRAANEAAAKVNGHMDNANSPLRKDITKTDADVNKTDGHVIKNNHAIITKTNQILGANDDTQDEVAAFGGGNIYASGATNENVTQLRRSYDAQKAQTDGRLSSLEQTLGAMKNQGAAQGRTLASIETKVDETNREAIAKSAALDQQLTDIKSMNIKNAEEAQAQIEAIRQSQETARRAYSRLFDSIDKRMLTADDGSKSELTKIREQASKDRDALNKRADDLVNDLGKVRKTAEDALAQSGQTNKQLAELQGSFNKFNASVETIKSQLADMKGAAPSQANFVLLEEKVRTAQLNLEELKSKLNNVPTNDQVKTQLESATKPLVDILPKALEALANANKAGASGDASSKAMTLISDLTNAINAFNQATARVNGSVPAPKVETGAATPAMIQIPMSQYEQLLRDSGKLEAHQEIKPGQADPAAPGAPPARGRGALSSATRPVNGYDEGEQAAADQKPADPH